MAIFGLSKHFSAEVQEYPCKGSDSSMVTFLVSTMGVIVITREYTSHRELLSRTLFSAAEIAWGGVLTATGSWVRRSFDFGDAPDAATRDRVISDIQKRLFA